MSAGKRRKYDREYEVEAVRLGLEPGRSVSGVARDLGISENVLHVWRAKLRREGSSAFPGKGHQSGEEEELRRLRRQLAEMAEERDILKKALGVFSQRTK